jgi:intracellular sulfur oxidation DsrE/DsrF family protein
MQPPASDDIDKMEDDMTRSIEDMDATPRRGFFARMAGAVALGVAGFAAAPRDAQAAANASDWPGALKGRNRQVVDAYEANAGFPLAYVHTFLLPNDPADTTGLLVLRHAAFPIALESAMWQKYKIGEALKIIDPETKAPAVKNPFFKPKSGVLIVDDMALDRLLAKGVIVGACNVAMTVQSKMLSGNAGVTPEEAYKEWAANVIPGVTVIPSGTWGVNRAQQAGCTYCAGG